MGRRKDDKRLPNNGAMGGNQRIQWWEPWRLTCRRGFRQLRAMGALNPMWWLRLVGMGLVGFAALCVVAGLALGWQALSFLPIGRTLVAALVMPPILLGGFLLTLMCPLQIDVRHKHLTVTHGSAIRIKHGDLYSFQVDCFSPSLRRLTLRGRTIRNNVVTLRYWLGRNVDAEALVTMLRCLQSEATGV